MGPPAPPFPSGCRKRRTTRWTEPLPHWKVAERHCPARRTHRTCCRRSYAVTLRRLRLACWSPARFPHRCTRSPAVCRHTGSTFCCRRFVSKLADHHPNNHLPGCRCCRSSSGFRGQRTAPRPCRSSSCPPHHIQNPVPVCWLSALNLFVLPLKLVGLPGPVEVPPS